MFYTKLCRFCRKVVVVRNDETAKDKRYMQSCIDNNLICECEK